MLLIGCTIVTLWYACLECGCNFVKDSVMVFLYRLSNMLICVILIICLSSVSASIYVINVVMHLNLCSVNCFI